MCQKSCGSRLVASCVPHFIQFGKDQDSINDIQDELDLCNEAIRLKEDVAFYEQCSRETRRLFEQKYSEKVFVQKTMEILESL